MIFELPKLKYSFTDLEPYIDAQTMEIHYGKHHQTYATNLTKAIEPYTDLNTKSAEELLKNLDDMPKKIAAAVKNNAGGYHNHNLYWHILSKNPQQQPTGQLLDKITSTFGSLDNLKNALTQAGLTRFGSGWAWLVVSGDTLEVLSTSNQDSPISLGKQPILGIDVWEHAYYLKYQNRRAEYLENFWKVLDWKAVEELFAGKGN